MVSKYRCQQDFLPVSAHGVWAMQKTLKVGSRITLQDQLQLMMQIELLNVVFMMNTISIKGHLELI